MLHACRYETGLGHYCGPTAIAMLTGCSYREARDAIARFNGQRNVTGTSKIDVQFALLHFGFDMRLFLGFDGPLWAVQRPTLASMLRTRTPAQRSQAWLVQAGQHWVVVQGKKGGCSLTGGKPVWTGEMQRRRARVHAIYVVTRRTA